MCVACLGAVSKLLLWSCLHGAAAAPSSGTPAPGPALGHATSHFTDWQPPASSERVVAVSALKSMVDQAMQNATDHEAGILAIEAAMGSTYRALPKNSNGLLSHGAAAYLVQKYFMAVHRYSIKGIGSTSTATASQILKMHYANVLQTNAPELVEALLDNHRGGHGLTLSDAAAMAATMHGMIMRHGRSLLEKAIEAAQRLKQLPWDSDAYGWAELKTAFHGWHVLLKAPSDYMDYEQFANRLHDPTYIMQEFASVAENIARTKMYQQRDRLNPFVKNTLSTMQVLDLVPDLIEDMGIWQDADCKAMKSALSSLDKTGSGRVPLETIYEQPVFRDAQGKLVYRFAESQDNLREIGALDESVPSNPKLLIMNYVLGPANCYRMSSYFTYCCLSQCESLMNEIERVVESPSASPDLLLPLVRNLSTALDDQARPLSTALVSKLDSIASRHEGVVPLHGRLFAQWLHFAFPLECPYPHVTDKDSAGNTLVTSYLSQKPATKTQALRSDTPDAHDVDPALSQWTDDEMLPLVEEEASSPYRIRDFVRTCGVQVARFSLLYTVYLGAKAGMSRLRSYDLKKRDAKDSSGWESAVDKLA